MQKVTSWVAILAVLGIAVGCGDDDGGQAAEGPGPALTPAQCPAAPTEVTLDSIAPVWSGLLVLNATVPSGTADGFEIQIFDPTLGAWTRSYGDYWQREDESYAISLSPSVSEQNKDSEFRVRIRSRLDGCAPSAWSEGPTFTLTDPISDTSWMGTWQTGAIASAINLGRIETQTQASLGTSTPELDGPVTHTVTFGADGTFDEIFAFTLKDADDEHFDGCSFTLHYSGTWDFVFSRNSFTVVISDRAPVEDAADGSSCAAPALGTLDINDAMLLPDLAIPGTVMTTAIEYRGLLSTPAAPVYLDSYQLTAALQNSVLLSALSYETATETGSVEGYFGIQSWVYEKQ